MTIESYVTCLNWDCDATIPVGWDDIDQVRTCARCGRAVLIEYDEAYDDETGEEHQYWYGVAPGVV